MVYEIPVDIVGCTPVVIERVVLARVILDEGVRGIHHGRRCREVRAHRNAAAVWEHIP
jgi:hypothetical protein